MAKAIYLQEGETIDFVNGATAVGYLDIIDLTSRIAIAQSDIAALATGSIALEGVYTIPADDSKSFAVGAPVYWDSVAGKATDDTTKTPAGFATVAMTTASTVTIKLGDRMLTAGITATNTATLTNKTIDANGNILKNVVQAYAASITRAEMVAGKTLVAGVAGRTIKVLNYNLRVTGAFNGGAGTALVIQDTNSSPVVITTAAKAALTDGAKISGAATVTNVTDGAGMTANLTAAKGIAVAADAAWDAGTSVHIEIEYMYV